jgi:hypothetical protein
MDILEEAIITGNALKVSMLVWKLLSYEDGKAFKLES